MRVFTAGLSCEVNTFAPIPTNVDSFRVNRPDKSGQTRGNPIAKALRAYTNVETVEGTDAAAPPGGLVARQSYEQLRDEILEQLRRAHTSKPVQAVLLNLHGAMVAHGYDDVEGFCEFGPPLFVCVSFWS